MKDAREIGGLRSNSVETGAQSAAVRRADHQISGSESDHLAALVCLLAAALISLPSGGCGGTDGQADAYLDSTTDTAGDAGADTDVNQTRRDHTVGRFVTVADFLTYAGTSQNPAQIKFIISDFFDAASVHFEEPGFYTMHDEWSWYSLLNGIEIPDYDFAPTRNSSFGTVTDIVEWARAADPLPYDLVFVADGTRLYSPKFYERAFNRLSDVGETIPRFFGCGSVLHFPADPRRPIAAETWAFELEYVDTPTVSDVEHFFDVLKNALPAEATAGIIWLVRSNAQKNIARQLDAEGGMYAHRWAEWESLQIPGESKTYNPGISAGVVRIFEPGESPVVDAAKTVAVLREIPDDLPPVAAIVTAVPQTPLSHIGILAKARGTPNLYVAGVADSERMKTWAAYKRSIIVQAREDGYLFREMSGAEWNFYLALSRPRQADIEPVDVSQLPETFDPAESSPTEMADLVPQIGGKTAGFLMLHAYPELDVPDRPFGLTVRGYAEFIATLDPPISEILAQAAMTDPRVQLVVTEGPEAYLAATGNSDAAKTWLDSMRKSHRDDVIGRAIDKGGIRQMIMTSPINAGYLSRITTLLKQRFAFLAPMQGLRFRSSSSAEDVEGFNGAGLYESHTGYLYPEVVPPKKQTKTVEDALRKVWASYWLFNAFQERANAGINHLNANMGVLVHPVFDDDREAANGVLTFELVRRTDGDVMTLTANMQKGSLSVTNPPPGSNAMPEVDVVRQTGSGEPAIERVAASTETDPGELLLSDAELTSLHAVLARMASDWLDLRNDSQKAYHRRSTITLDLEIKRMSAGWPTLVDGTVNPERLVIKQARTVERPILAPQEFYTMPAPRDVLAYTVKIEKRSCTAGPIGVDAYEFFTDPSHPWPFDHAKAPFDSHVAIRFADTIDGFGFTKGSAFVLTHMQAEFSHPGLIEGEPWKLTVAPVDPASAKFETFVVDSSGPWAISGSGGAQASGFDAACTVETLLMSPQAFLESLMGG